jgi:dihydrofolate synthase/folylpolyglutamate synthase
MAYEYRGYEDTVNYLYSLQKHGIKLGLSNIRELMRMLGEPHRAFRSIHIAGTNGKGSTATALASILTESGFRTGLFTSPHLVSFTERIRINGQKISEDEVIDLASQVRTCIGDSPVNPTFFEFVTAMAFYYFAREKVDWAVIETGMGGRLDATNVLNPEITIITNINRDHCEFLGDTVSDITYEKAGIIKHTVPVITASPMPEVVTQLKQIAESHDAEIHVYNKEFSGTILQMDDRHITLDYKGYRVYKNLTVRLTGEYQLYNISLAVRACEVLKQNGVLISETSIRRGLNQVDLEGRLERISHAPPIILDGAHNPEAARSLAVSMRKLFPDKKVILIVGIMGDKNIQGILKPIIEIADDVILTKATYERAASPAKLKEIMSAIQQSGTDSHTISVNSTRSVSEALDRAKSLCGEDHVILVTGSFYTTGEVKEITGCTSVLPKLREYK